MLKELLKVIGVERDRLRLEWISASEGKKFSEVIDDFVDDIRELGPNPIKEDQR